MFDVSKGKFGRRDKSNGTSEHYWSSEDDGSRQKAESKLYFRTVVTESRGIG